MDSHALGYIANKSKQATAHQNVQLLYTFIMSLGFPFTFPEVEYKIKL